MVKFLNHSLGSNEREIKKLQPLVEEINALEPEIRKLSDGELRAKGKGLTLDKFGQTPMIIPVLIEV